MNIFDYVVSIHHMLLFIEEWFFIQASESHVSIHHMLLFIRLMCFLQLGESRFNTSHVTLYLLPVILQAGVQRFNTSHVTLYPNMSVKLERTEQFQYITCYSLSAPSPDPSSSTGYVSIHHMLLFIIVGSVMN